MALTLDLSASTAKLNRAFEHLDTLDRELPAVLKQNGPYTARFSNVDRKTGWCEIYLAPNPAKPQFGILIGEIVHNLRCALDYIITALVDSSNVPLTTSHRFPIFFDKALYVQKVGSATAAKRGGCLNGVVHGLGFIERVQPYHLQPDPRLDPLWHVHRLSNADTHREITTFVPVPVRALEFKCDGNIVERDHNIPAIVNWSPDKEAMISRMRFDPPVAENLRVEGELQIMPVFTTPPFGHEPEHTVYRQTLRKTGEHVRTIVDLFKTL